MPGFSHYHRSFDVQHQKQRGRLLPEPEGSSLDLVQHGQAVALPEGVGENAAGTRPVLLHQVPAERHGDVFEDQEVLREEVPEPGPLGLQAAERVQAEGARALAAQLPEGPAREELLANRGAGVLRVQEPVRPRAQLHEKADGEKQERG